MLNVTAGGNRPAARRPHRRGRAGGRAAHAQAVLGSMLRSGRLPALVVVLGALTLLYGFLFSRDFSISSVVVRGTSIGSPAEVVVTADTIGESIFRMDAGEAAERIARLPYVERVTVTTRFPDSVVISVTERTPVAIWRSGQESFLIDGRGNVLSEGGADGLPVLFGDGAAPAVGEAVDPAIVASLVALQSELGADLVEIRLTRDNGLVARFSDRRAVIFGEPERIPLKLAILGEVERLQADWATLDLREPARPYYK